MRYSNENAWSHPLNYNLRILPILRLNKFLFNTISILCYVNNKEDNKNRLENEHQIRTWAVACAI